MTTFYEQWDCTDLMKWPRKTSCSAEWGWKQVEQHVWSPLRQVVLITQHLCCKFVFSYRDTARSSPDIYLFFFTPTTSCSYMSSCCISLSPSFSLSLSLTHTHISFFLFFLAVIVQRVQAELSQQVSSLQSDGRVSWVAPTHICIESVLYKLQALAYINRTDSVLRYKKLSWYWGGGFLLQKTCSQKRQRGRNAF